jgi:uncharacterized protein (TIGR03437 family)
VKFHIFAFFAVITLLNSFFTASAQVDSVIGQVTSSLSESFAGGISGDGRFIVFESIGNIATENPRNTDNNREIFLFDYAQRRIFQITDTKALLKDTTKAITVDNIKVDIVSLRPVISRQPDANGNYWIAFSSNATTSTPTTPNDTNPGSFDANAFTGTGGANPLTTDGNTEMWLYRVPAFTPVADLSEGDEIPLNVLTGGAFTRVTNTLPSRLPVAGTTTTFPIVADDNHDSSIDDTGSAISFTSNRDVVPCATPPASATCGNAAPNFDNDEIYSYVREGGVLTQLSATTRGTVGNPIYNANSTITNLSAGGWRVVFLSNGSNPIPGMTGSNADNNEEIFYVDLTSAGALGATRRQVTTTARTNPGDVVNIFNYGRRMSRDGRYIAFDSYADLANENSGTNQTSFATYVFDTTLTGTAAFRRILARSTADSGASGGDIQRYPGFTTSLDSAGVPQTSVVLETRMNIKSDGTIPTNADEGLNNVAARPAQLYSFLLNVSAGADAAKYVRLTKLPTPSFFLASIQPLTTDLLERMAFNLSQTETGTGNADLASEVYYYVLPEANTQSAAGFSFSTGASRIAVTASPVPTPSPTPTPTATPTPTPQQPAAVQGVSPGMLAILDYDSGLNQPVTAKTAVGSIERRFTLPIELAGVTLTVNGAAAGLKTVGRRQIVFVVPPGLAGSDAGTVYPVVVNNNGVVFKGNLTVVRARPDIFTDLPSPGPGGRARAFNATNRVLTREPFTIRTFRLRGSRLVPTVLRIYLTGVDNLAASSFSGIRIGNTQIPLANVLTGATLVEPGVYSIDITLPASLAGAGDQPLIIAVTVNGVTYTSRLDDTAPRIFIL